MKFLYTLACTCFVFIAHAQYLHPLKWKSTEYGQMSTTMPNGDLVFLERDGITFLNSDGRNVDLANYQLRRVDKNGKSAVFARYPAMHKGDTIHFAFDLEYYQGKFYSMIATTNHGVALFELGNDGLNLIKSWPNVKPDFRTNEKDKEFELFPSNARSLKSEGQLPMMTQSMDKLYLNAPLRIHEEYRTGKLRSRQYWYALWMSDGTTDGTVPATKTSTYADLRLHDNVYKRTKTGYDKYLATDDYLVVRKFPFYDDQASKSRWILQKDVNFELSFSHSSYAGIARPKGRSDFFYQTGWKNILKVTTKPYGVDTIWKSSSPPLDESLGLPSPSQFFALENGDLVGVGGVNVKYLHKEDSFIWEKSNVLDTANLRWYSSFITDKESLIYAAKTEERITHVIEVDRNLKERVLSSFTGDATELQKYGEEIIIDYWNSVYVLNYGSISNTKILKTLFDDPVYIGGKVLVENEGKAYLLELIRGALVQVYKDKNGNGVKDMDEKGVSNQKVEIDDKVFVTGHNGEIITSLGADLDTSKKVAFRMDTSRWELTTSNLELDIPKGYFTTEDTLSFGVIRKPNKSAVYVGYRSSRSRCRSAKVVIPNIQNDYDEDVEIELHLQLDTLNAVDSFPSEFDSLGNGSYSVKRTLKANETYRPFFYTTVAAFRNADMWIDNHLQVQAKLSTGQSYLYNKYERSRIRCAFDPNDKAADGIGISKREFLLQTDTSSIEYLIRFQNVGNDTAYNVVVVDTLSQKLDYSSLELSDWSHEMKTTLDDGGVLTFDFENIMLPDSNVDEKGSNGYVKFKLKPIKDQPHRTAVYNKAGIYFDFNDPVITNRARTVLVNEMPVDKPEIVSVILSEKPSIKLELKVDDPFAKSLEIQRSFGDTLSFSKKYENSASTKTWTDDKLTAEGIYYYRMQTINGDEKSAWSSTKSVEYKIDNVDESRFARSVKIYPNPAQNQLNVQINTKQSGQLILLDISGKQILQQTISGNTVLDVSYLPKGPYMLKVSVDGNQMEKMISLQ